MVKLAVVIWVEVEDRRVADRFFTDLAKPMKSFPIVKRTVLVAGEQADRLDALVES